MTWPDHASTRYGVAGRQDRLVLGRNVRQAGADRPEGFSLEHTGEPCRGRERDFLSLFLFLGSACRTRRTRSERPRPRPGTEGADRPTDRPTSASDFVALGRGSDQLCAGHSTRLRSRGRRSGPPIAGAQHVAPNSPATPLARGKRLAGLVSRLYPPLAMLASIAPRRRGCEMWGRRPRGPDAGRIACPAPSRREGQAVRRSCAGPGRAPNSVGRP